MSNRRAADLAAIGTIVLAGALSTFWVFLVPIFQSPDEPQHFDYAISIFNAHRLISRADGPSDWIVSPYTKYLMRASDYDRIAGHSPMRVPAGYGKRDYYARVDAGAPSLARPTPPNGKINYIVRLYPFGFYALEALWMRAAASLTNSMVDVFFAGRILCVFLTMLGLYFNYRTALNLGVGRWTSVALIGAIGFFPLTSLVSSYVQPDTLAYMLVSAALFFATQLRNRAPSPSRVAPLGLALGLLSITKYHFFICAALPVALLVGVALVRAKASHGRALAAFAWLLVPAVGLLCVQHWGVDSGTAVSRTKPSDINLLYVRSVLAQGLVPAIRYAIGSLLGVFLGCFVSGICAAGFWQVLGWGDVPIVVGNPTAEGFVRLAIGLITLAVAVIVGFGCSRNTFRLLKATARGHARIAASIAAGDAVINSYLCLVAFFFALYVVTNNVFGISGRHWYPYIFPAFLCFVWYAPRALGQRNPRVSAILAGALLTYSVVAAAYAAMDAKQRYYGPDAGRYAVTDPARAPVLGVALGALWPLQNAIYNFAASSGQFSFDRGTNVAVSGAAMRNGDNGASRVAVVLDGKQPLSVLTGQYLFGIAEATHSITGGYSGFSATVSSARLREGAHAVSAYAQLQNGDAYTRIEPKRIFFVTDRAGHFSQPFLRKLKALPPGPGVLKSDGVCRGRATTSGGVLSVVSGSVLLLAGSIAPQRRARLTAVWLLVDDRPYPARFDADRGAFIGTLPTSALSSGAHRITAYAIGAGNSPDARVSVPIALTIVPGAAQSDFLASPPPACADPLRELAQT